MKLQLGKLTFWLVGWFVGYDHTVCNYKDIGDEYDPTCKFLALRITSGKAAAAAFPITAASRRRRSSPFAAAIFGCALVPLTYMILRQLGGSKWGAILGASFIIFDDLNLIESRLILVDAQLLFYCALALYTALRYWAECEGWGPVGVISKTVAALQVETKQRENEGDVYDVEEVAAIKLGPEGFKGGWKRRIFWAVAVGVTCGLAISVKWTALVTPGLIAIECAFGLFFLRKTIPNVDMLIMGVCVFFTYVFFFWAHFAILIKSGDGDAHMFPEFQATLIGNSHYNPNAPYPGFWRTFFYTQYEMLRSNAGVDQRHNWESEWWSWPINRRGVMYWSKDLPQNWVRLIYLMGNPAVIWFVSAATVLFLFAGFLYLRFRHMFGALQTTTPGAQAVTPGEGERSLRAFFTVGIYCLLAYALNLLPYVGVARSCFIYHHLPGLFYGELLAALTVDKLFGRWNSYAAKLVLAFILVVWILYSPWVYGIATPRDLMVARRWLPTWD